MEKTFCIIENSIVINPNTKKERNLTEEAIECSYCKDNKKTCIGNKKGKFCDWFTIKEGYIELTR